MSDPFQATRAALAAARLALEAGQATNKDFQTYIRLVEERLTPSHKHYDGDAPGAAQSLRQLLANLVALKAAPKATATGSNGWMRQQPTRSFCPVWPRPFRAYARQSSCYVGLVLDWLAGHDQLAVSGHDRHAALRG
jgi:hypothetical protein